MVLVAYTMALVACTRTLVAYIMRQTTHAVTVVSKHLTNET